jgi:hypothetical protein
VVETAKAACHGSGQSVEKKGILIRPLLEELVHVRTEENMQTASCQGFHRGRARGALDKAHLTEKRGGMQNGQTLAWPSFAKAEYFDRPFHQEEDVVAEIALVKDNRGRTKLALFRQRIEEGDGLGLKPLEEREVCEGVMCS